MVQTVDIMVNIEDIPVKKSKNIMIPKNRIELVKELNVKNIRETSDSINSDILKIL